MQRDKYCELNQSTGLSANFVYGKCACNQCDE